MKKITLISIVLLLVLAMTALVGCADLTESSGEIKELTVGVLDALDEGDVNKAYTFIAPEGCTKVQFKEFASQVAYLFEGDGYELKQTYIGVVTTNGVTEKTAEYQMTTATGEKVQVVAHTRSDMEGLAGFQLIPAEEIQQQQSHPATAIFGVISLLELTFMIVMLVDCCRHKMKLKALWIVLIILAAFSAVIQVGNGFSMHFNFNLFFGFTSFTSYGDGAFDLRIMVPIGAIIYLIMRKKLFAAAAVPTAETIHEAAPEAAPAEPIQENGEKSADESADQSAPFDGDQAEN